MPHFPQVKLEFDTPQFGIPILPKLVIHGGILTQQRASSEHHLEQRLHEAMATIVQQTYEVLCSVGARAAVVHGIRCLEDETLFNAGTGTMLPADHQIHLSASLMDSATQCFSGVINLEDVKNPIEVANLLAKEAHTILAGPPATAYARRHGIPPYHPPQPKSDKLQGGESEFTPSETGNTVGAVAIDGEGIICAGTSTGGMGYETPGRISDITTVAGTYATSVAGISCTGTGEHILNHGVAVKIITRVQDGMLLSNAIEKTLREAKAHHYRFGLIGLDNNGNVVVNQTIDTEDYAVIYASYDGQILKVFP